MIKANIRYGSNSYAVKPVNVLAKSPSIHTGVVEENRKKFVDWFGTFGTFCMSLYTFQRLGTRVVLASTSSEAIRTGFSQIVDVFSAIAEPILWGYAVIGLVMVATGSSRQQGWDKVKKVAYAYIGIQALPAFFAFLRYLAKLLTQALTFAQ